MSRSGMRARTAYALSAALALWAAAPVWADAPASAATGPGRAVLTVLPTLGGGSGEPVASNDHSVAVGYSVTSNGASHAVMWQAGALTDLTPDALAGTATAVDDHGDVLGRAVRDPGGEGFVLFRWHAGALTWYASPAVLAVNTSGETVRRTATGGLVLVDVRGRPTAIPLPSGVPGAVESVLLGERGVVALRARTAETPCANSNGVQTTWAVWRWRKGFPARRLTDATIGGSPDVVSVNRRGQLLVHEVPQCVAPTDDGGVPVADVATAVWDGTSVRELGRWGTAYTRLNDAGDVLLVSDESDAAELVDGTRTTALPPVGPGNAFHAQVLGARGQVGGTDSRGRGLVWDRGAYTPLSAPAGAITPVATAIDKRGTAYGRVTELVGGAYAPVPVRWDIRH